MADQPAPAPKTGLAGPARWGIAATMALFALLLGWATVTPIRGAVVAVSPTTIQDPVTGLHYYRVTVAVPEAEVARLGALDLVPGMPLEGYLSTGERPVLSYLLRPLTDQLGRAFREE